MTESVTWAARSRGLQKYAHGPEGRVDILHGVDLDVAAGEAVAIVGASGAGKSTLLALLAGLDTPSAGEVELFGTALNGLDEDGRARLRAGRVGFVFQSFQLLPALTALENVMLPLELAGQSNARRTALEVLEQVGLASRASHLPAQLSGGEQQRTAIARAFASQPDLLFADEPTGNLDQHTGQRISGLLFDLRSRHGTALVLVTHDTGLAERCDRCCHLREGRLDG